MSEFLGPPPFLEILVCERCGNPREHSLACIQAGHAGHPARKVLVTYWRTDPQGPPQPDPLAEPKED